VKKIPDRPQRRTYSEEFKRAAVDRIIAGEAVLKVARDLGVRRKFLYLWRDQGKGTNGEVRTRIPVVESAEDRRITKLKKRVAELERLAGRQAAELDFFAAALHSIKPTRRSSGVNSGEGSTQ
jgi:transposase